MVTAIYLPRLKSIFLTRAQTTRKNICQAFMYQGFIKIKGVWAPKKAVQLATVARALF